MYFDASTLHKNAKGFFCVAVGLGVASALFASSFLSSLALTAIALGLLSDSIANHG